MFLLSVLAMAEHYDPWADQAPMPCGYISISCYTLAPMSKLKFNSRTLDLNQYETVLNCLLRNGEAIPYACKAGMCQACLIRAVDCEATEESRKWIKPTLQAQGYTLACQWVPDHDVAAELPSVKDFSVTVRILALEKLSERVICLKLAVPDPSTMYAYRPGQYLTLINPAGLARSYSIANDYERDGYIELHVGSTLHGIFTHWLFTQAKVGEELHMRGPAGDCFYAATDASSHPLLLAGTGTGLAPLYGIVQDALQQGHKAEISLFHGGRTSTHLYYVEKLQQLAASYSNFTYYPCTIENSGAAQIHTGTLETVLENTLDKDKLAQTRVYLCGAPEFVHALRKRIFLKGARAANIHCDPFTERKVVDQDTAKAQS